MRGERVRAAGFIVSSGRRGDGTGSGCAFDMFLVREPVDLELVFVQGSRPGGDKWTTAAAPSSSSHTVAADILFASWSLESGGGRCQLEEETRSRRGDC